jgi:uncharacterized protein HemX
MTSDFGEVPPYQKKPRRRATDNVMPKADLSDPALHTAKELRRGLRVLMALTAVLYVVMLGVAGYTFRQSQRNTKALCTIRANAADRVEQTEQFLRDHPNGLNGITVLDLRRSIQTYQNTVRALNDVKCPPPSTP